MKFPQEKCCCGAELKNDGPFAMGITQENSKGGSWGVPDYCLTEECQNFKHKEKKEQ